jgi:hypothetical protein
VTDVLMLAIVAAFFLVAGALVVGCDRILGDSENLDAEVSLDDDPGSRGVGADAAARHGVVR